jgi:hypothetical protein
MKIDEAINETIIAIYRDPKPPIPLFLKGGSAIRLFDDLTSRLSIDIDFSVDTAIDDVSSFFNAMKFKISRRFHELQYEAIDLKWMRKPKNKGGNKPDWWGGWSFEFKLVSFVHSDKSVEMKRRNAVIPEGANSSKIIVEISEHEYCKCGRTKVINGISILGYSRELIVLEKIRAICQQHPEYKFKLSKNRARDFYDIYELTKNIDDDFAHRCSLHLESVFKAKGVPILFLNSLWEEDFIDKQRRGFDQVKDTVQGKVYDFDFYLENLRFLVKEIYPNISI